MGLVTRAGRPYLYKTVRKDGQVRVEYIASGEAALELAAIDRVRAEHKSLAKAEKHAERERLAAVDRAISESYHLVQVVAEAALVLSGCRRHKREWRRRRGTR